MQHCKACHRRRKLWARYQIDEHIYDHMLRQANFRCMICGKRAKKRSRVKKLSVDHCHKTKRIRGLLCLKCNRGLGTFNESAKLLERAAAYLKVFGNE